MKEDAVVTCCDFTMVGDVTKYLNLVHCVASDLGLGGWVSTAASGNLIGRAMGSRTNISHFKWWLQYVAPGNALMQDSRYLESVNTRLSDLGDFHVM